MSVVAVLIYGPMRGVETKMVLYGSAVVIRKIRRNTLAIFIKTVIVNLVYLALQMAL